MRKFFALPEDVWAEKISQWTHKNIAFDGGTAFEFGRDYFKFKDKSGNQITVKITSK